MLSDYFEGLCGICRLLWVTAIFTAPICEHGRFSILYSRQLLCCSEVCIVEVFHLLVRFIPRLFIWSYHEWDFFSRQVDYWWVGNNEFCCCFETEFHVLQVGLVLAIKLKMTLFYWSFCLCLLGWVMEFRHSPSHPVCAVLGMGLWASCMPGELSVNWATFPVPGLFGVCVYFVSCYLLQSGCHICFCLGSLGHFK